MEHLISYNSIFYSPCYIVIADIDDDVTDDDVTDEKIITILEIANAINNKLIKTKKIELKTKTIHLKKIKWQKLNY